MLRDFAITQESWDSMNAYSNNNHYAEWVLGINVAGHGGSICLLRNGQIQFFLKEERSTGMKRDHFLPFRSLKEIKKYTDKLDLVVCANIDGDKEQYFSNQLRKLKIDVEFYSNNESEQALGSRDIWDDSLLSFHHINHASCGYHLSPFCVEDEEVLIIVMDGWGGIGTVEELFSESEELDDFIAAVYNQRNEFRAGIGVFEHVSVYSATPMVNEWELLYKEVASDFTRNSSVEGFYPDMKCVENDYKVAFESNDRTAAAEIHLAPTCSTPVLYEAVTQLIGFHQEDVGKTMGLAPYGKPNENIPPFAVKNEYLDVNDIVDGIVIDTAKYSQMIDFDKDSPFQNRADVAYKVQKTLEDKVINVVEKAMSLSNSKKIVLSGGTFHNIIINEILASKYPDYQFFADPICDDAGHSFGAAMFYWKSHGDKGDFKYSGFAKPEPPDTMYLGPEYSPEEQLKRIKKWFKKSANK